MALAPGVYWLRMGLPFALDHINLWLLRDTLGGVQGWTVVDCCIDKPESRAQWEQIFAQHLDGLPILRVIATHMHPDHVGLAHWLCERWCAPLCMSATDYNTARVTAQTDASWGGDLAVKFYAAHGVNDSDSLEKIKARGGYYAGMVPKLPTTYQRLMDGQALQIAGHTWRCISGYGHAPEHIALHCEALGLLISGDMVLPRISTNVSVFTVEPEGNPLALFLSSIEKYLALPTDTLTLPSHGKPFRGLHQRIAQLQDHHRERLAEVLAACVQPRCAAQIVPIMFKRALDLHQLTFALGEALAHLHYLWHAGQLHRELGADGVYRFTLASVAA